MAKGKYQEWLTPEGLAQLEGWARDGLTDAQIAHNIGIRRPTLYDWKKKYPDISDALKRGKEVVDQMVAGALVKRALGMTVRTKTSKMVKVDAIVLKANRSKRINELKLLHDDWGQSQLVIQAALDVPTWEEIPMVVTDTELAPSETAAMFWLKNRKPEQYRDKSFSDLNEAQKRKADAEADISEFKRDMMTGAGGNDEGTVIIDDFGEDEDQTETDH